MAFTTADIALTLEGVPGAAETVRGKKDSPIQQVLVVWLRQRGLDPGPWRLIVHSTNRSRRPLSTFSEAIPVETLIEHDHTTKRVAPDDTTATERERKCGWKKREVPLINATVSFRGIELPQIIAPPRLAACAPGTDTRRAPSGHPALCPWQLLDAARAALAAKPWAAGVKGWFEAAHWCKVFGLDAHFTAPGQATAALSLLKAVKRPSAELDVAVSKKYFACVTYEEAFNDFDCGDLDGYEDYDGCMGREGFTLRIAKLAGLPYMLLWRESSFSDEIWGANVMLAMGTMPAAGSGGAGGRLRYKEIYSYTIGDLGEDIPGRLNLQAFLPLRARVLERFPAVAQLSDMQLLLLLKFATQPMPMTPVEYINVYNEGTQPLDAVAEEFTHVERMPGHPQAPPGPPQLVVCWGREGEPGVPAGLELDNSLTGDRGYEYVDGLPIGSKLTGAFFLYLQPILSLVTQFHLGQRR